MTHFYNGLDIVQCKEQFPSLDINYCQFLLLGIHSMSWKYAFSLIINFSFILLERLLFNSEPEVLGQLCRKEMMEPLLLSPSSPLVPGSGEGFTENETLILPSPGNLVAKSMPESRKLPTLRVRS